MQIARSVFRESPSFLSNVSTALTIVVAYLINIWSKKEYNNISLPSPERVRDTSQTTLYRDHQSVNKSFWLTFVRVG